MLIHFKFGKLFKNKIPYKVLCTFRLPKLKLQNIASDIFYSDYLLKNIHS